jgi:L-ascorbate metabolism protein UlaG (beta-lactamase superfamily)
MKRIASPGAPLYLGSNVVVEPLVDQWYAWAHLIPPATAARNITERHLRIMDSYIAAPEAHAAAVKNPKLLGGPFMDYDGNRAEEIAALRDKTKRDRSHLLALSKAIGELDAMLRTRALGCSLECLYAEVPEPLQGYVELTYDLNNHASFRLLEPLLYKSSYYDRSMQSLMLSTISADDRPFVLSTPRLKTGREVELRWPFESERLDRLFELTTKPATCSQIKSLVDLDEEDHGLFGSFFTEDPPPAYGRYDGGGARWRYFGHACILLETKRHSILLDPVLSYTYDSDISRYTYQDLPEFIDFVLITHNHQDHILFETLLQLRHRIGTIVVPRNGGGALQDPSLKLMLKACGFRNVIEVGEMEELPLDDGSITAVPFLGEHGDLNVPSKMAYLVRAGGHSLLFAADSCNISPKMYEHVHRDVGDIDVLFLGMECDGAPMSWIYGPLLTQKLERAMDQSRRLAGSNCARAMSMVNQFHCSEVYVYAMGQEPWLNYVMSLKYTPESNPIVQSDQLIETCKERGINAERLFGEKEILLP